MSYNVNGIRSALNKGLAEWLSAHPASVVCLQETKARHADLPADVFPSIGYPEAFWHEAEKSGYSGVVTISQTAPDLVIEGCGIPHIDREGRILRTDFGDLTILNCYFPSGTTGQERQAFKMAFLEEFSSWLSALKRARPNLVVAGDLNIAHTEQDIHDPKGNKKSSGFLPEERSWFSGWLSSGYIDTFRFCNPDQVAYSWWTYRANARAKNKGWRIDYLVASGSLETAILRAGIHPDAMHSDHCPVWLELMR